MVNHEPTEQRAVSFGWSAPVGPAASGPVKVGSQVAMMATMDSSALPGGDWMPVPKADRA